MLTHCCEQPQRRRARPTPPRIATKAWVLGLKRCAVPPPLLPPRFPPGASWNAAVPTVNVLRQFETNSGVLKSPERQPFAPSARWRRKINYPLLPGDFDRPEVGA